MGQRLATRAEMMVWIRRKHATAWLAFQTIATILVFVAAGVYVVLTGRL